ncbi:LPP20 family lipoprotein [Parashewanella tropica]|uniref:LPP20 family lipoprotein n=1 Tax=Parashewanella tropica TaxID=2547970 RepID=UPI001059A0F3|nr:LPP20 family lipoprotein [Parashewanella tropica]
MKIQNSHINLTNIKKALLVLAPFILSACSNTSGVGEDYRKQKAEQFEREVELQQQTLNTIPDWFLTPLKSDENGFYAVASGQAKSLNSAIRKAELRAQTSLAGNISQLISAQEKLFNKSTAVDEGDTLQSAIDSFIQEQNVAGTEFDKKVIAQIGNEFIVYVRAYLPVKEIQRAKQKLDFAKDLDLASAEAQRELMNRVHQAKKLQSQVNQTPTNK